MIKLDNIEEKIIKEKKYLRNKSKNYKDNFLKIQKFIEKEVYNIEDKSLKEISNIIRSDQNGYKILDLSNWFKLKDGDYLFNKGKHKDCPIKDHKGYLEWLIGNPNIENNSRLVGKLIGKKLNIIS